MPAWPVVTDDAGDKISGTIFNKALTDAMKAYLDGLVVATGAGAGVDAKDIIDEVVTARGTKASLDARLDVALNEDGTPKAVAGQATTTEVGRQVNGADLARNRWMTSWNSGATAAPDFYVTAGAGVAIQQCGVGLADTTQVGAGRYTARVTSAAGNAVELRQMVVASTELDDFTALRGRKVNFAVRGSATSANAFRLIVTDGVNTTTSDYNANLGGAGVAEDLTVQHTIAATATYLQVSVEVALGTLTVYLGAYSLTFGDILPTRFEAPAEVEPFRADIGQVRTVYRQIATFASNTVLANSAVTWPMPANTLTGYGQWLEIEGEMILANNANAKSAKIYIGTNFITFFVDNVALAPNMAYFRLRLWRQTSTSWNVAGIVTFHAAGGAPPTVWHWAGSPAAGGATDFTTAQDVKLELITPTANADITLARYAITLHM